MGLHSTQESVPQQALAGSRKQLTRLVTSKMTRQPTEDDFHALQEIIAGNATVVDFQFRNNVGPAVTKVKPFIGKWFPAVGLVTLERQQLPEIVCHYECVGKGCHRDAIKVKVDVDMNMPMSSVATQSKASVAFICKIVPNSSDQPTLDDYSFLNNCQKQGVEKGTGGSSVESPVESVAPQRGK